MICKDKSRKLNSSKFTNNLIKHQTFVYTVRYILQLQLTGYVRFECRTTIMTRLLWIEVLCLLIYIYILYIYNIYNMCVCVCVCVSLCVWGWCGCVRGCAQSVNVIVVRNGINGTNSSSRRNCLRLALHYFH